MLLKHWQSSPVGANDRVPLNQRQLADRKLNFDSQSSTRGDEFNQQLKPRFNFTLDTESIWLLFFFFPIWQVCKCVGWLDRECVSVWMNVCVCYPVKNVVYNLRRVVRFGGWIGDNCTGQIHLNRAQRSSFVFFCFFFFVFCLIILNAVPRCKGRLTFLGSSFDASVDWLCFIPTSKERFVSIRFTSDSFNNNKCICIKKWI